MKYEAVKNIAEAINEIILPKFNLYVEDKKNDPSILAKIDARIKEIEDAEDIVSEIQSNITFKSGDLLRINGFSFYYNDEKEELILDYNKKDSSTNHVLYNEGLSDTWRSNSYMRSRILAIVSGLGDVTFEDALKLVEDQIDFQEFINMTKVNN